MQKTSSENDDVSQNAKTLKKYNNDRKNEMSSTREPKDIKNYSQVIAEEMLEALNR